MLPPADVLAYGRRAARAAGIDAEDGESFAAGTTVDLIVEGMEERVGAAVWDVVLATSPHWSQGVGEIDTALLDDTVLAY